MYDAAEMIDCLTAVSIAEHVYAHTLINIYATIGGNIGVYIKNIIVIIIHLLNFYLR